MEKSKFFSLDTPTVRALLKQKQTPVTGIFVSDGNRRLVMARTGKCPEEKGFWQAYLETVTGCFKENLDVFFSHGLENLFFPIFGDSLLERGKAYVETVIPELTRILFEDETWLGFYKKNNIRVKSYGDLKKLDAVFPGRGLPGKIKQAEALTVNHAPHTLYYGFFSSPFAGVQMRERLNDFVSAHGREPDHDESIALYYGEPVRRADFFINSIRIGGLGALPPLITGRETKIYTLPAPAIFSLSQRTYREILYDMLFTRPGIDLNGNPCGQDSQREDHPPVDRETGIRLLNRFFDDHQNTVLGTGKKINRFWVLDLCGSDKE